MSDSARAFMAFLLIAVVLIFTPKYLKLVSPAKPAPEVSESAAPLPAAQPAAATPSVPRAPSAEPVALTPDWEPPAPVRREVSAFPEQTTVIETDLYRAVLSNRGGGHLEQFHLKKYFDRRGDGVVQMILDGSNDVNLRISFINLDGDSTVLRQPFETLESPGLGVVYLAEGESARFVFRHTFESGTSVTKELLFTGGTYTIPITLDWTKPALEFGISTYEIAWPNGLKPTESRIKEDELYSKVFVYQGDELESEGSSGGKVVPRRQLTGATQWVAQRNKYFTAALLASQSDPAAFGALAVFPERIRNGGDKPADLSKYYMALGYAPDHKATVTLYLGPMSYFTIKDLDVGLEQVMNFGFALIRPISKGVLFALVGMHKYIPNYGIILILFAVAIRVVTNPLTKKSFTSMSKMSQVQPKLKEIQAKYKGNPQKLNKETMELWKREGVNPMGGCLPIVIQMPLLFALFIVFRTTIELRGEPFLFWITDLSAPDVVFQLPFTIPLYGSGVTVLAPIMAVTMFVQQKFSGAASNPQQKQMMYIMPLFFFFLFNAFPSGLNLYYAFSNMLSIIQQRNIRKNMASAQDS